jgi:hypothetical protein
MEDKGLSGLIILICDFANKHVPENSTGDFESQYDTVTFRH